jgi:hypothetical protein
MKKISLAAELFFHIRPKILDESWQHWAQPMPDAPPNVLLSPWLPQLDILAHPNVKLFITHGGAGSLQEALCYKTPMVGIPFGSSRGSRIFLFLQIISVKKLHFMAFA